MSNRQICEILKVHLSEKVKQLQKCLLCYALYEQIANDTFSAQYNRKNLDLWHFGRSTECGAISDQMDRLETDLNERKGSEGGSDGEMSEGGGKSWIWN